MKILHVITRLLQGGAEEKTFRELEGLRPEHEFQLASGPETAATSVTRLEKLGVGHHVIPSLRHYAPWRAASAIRQLRELIRRERFDVVHTHSAEAGILGREAARREGVRAIVHTIHGLEFAPTHPWPIRRAVVALHRRLAPHTTRYFSNADILTRAFLLKGIGTPPQYVTIRSGVPVDEVAQAQPIPLPGAPAILTAARLARGKGVEDVLRAAASLRDQFPDLRLYVAGEGPRRPALERLSGRLGLSSAVSFLGHRADLPGLLRGANLFAFASEREGTPRVVTEALAAGCPVVATAVDGIPEQIQNGETGLLVPPRDPDALADAMRSCLRNAEGARIRARLGSARVLRFSIREMLAALRSEYEKLAASD